jgi:hypothetical protein
MKGLAKNKRDKFAMTCAKRSMASISVQHADLVLPQMGPIAISILAIEKGFPVNLYSLFYLTITLEVD